MRDLLSAVDLNRDLERVKISEVEKLKGEAIVNNRKAKLIYLYDWTITGKWQGYLKQVSNVRSPILADARSVILCNGIRARCV